MRLFGHPVHVMLIHFPVALWPAHEGLHLFASRLPAGVAATAGFWLLVAGTGLGWLAAFFGVSDVVEMWSEGPSPALKNALIHAGFNGSVVAGFTVISVLEYRVFPSIAHGPAFLIAEAVLLLLMFAGNYFGGAVVWGASQNDAPQMKGER
jgi:uncharacterized membrane protein